MNYPARVSLGHYPTPIEKLARLGAHLGGPALYVKRDDQKIALDAVKLSDAGIAASQLAVDVNAGYLGGGYSVVGDLERDAIRTVARMEGLLLDPVYTGRAMGGLIDLIRRGAFARTQSILFWHTGGTAALSAFGDEL